MATLYVVATPIGNLEDLSPRAAKVLGQVPVVAAESLARTRGLLSHLGLTGKRLISCREANRTRAAQDVVQALGAGQDVALISDSGTPGVSDPGAAVVKAAAVAGHRVSPLPGPSALASAISLAGVEAAPVVFLGFAPAKPGPRRKLLDKAVATGWPLVLFEAPHRLAKTAADLLQLLGDRPVLLARELSKIHEEVVHTTCRDLAVRAGGGPARGEITLVVAGAPEQSRSAAGDEEVDELLRAGLAEGAEAPSRLARWVAVQTGLGRESVYQRLLELKEQIPAQEETGRRPHLAPPATRIDPVPSPEAIAEQDRTLQRQLKVNNSLGLHARVAARIAQTVQNYQCQLTIAKDGLQADGSSVLSILTLDAPQGSELVVEAQGAQACEALDALEALFAADFGEN
jgi:16S rRNA (cytidine1402-2'-O)-methyltransferase